MSISAIMLLIPPPPPQYFYLLISHWLCTFMPCSCRCSKIRRSADFFRTVHWKKPQSWIRLPHFPTLHILCKWTLSSVNRLLCRNTMARQTSAARPFHGHVSSLLTRQDYLTVHTWFNRSAETSKRCEHSSLRQKHLMLEVYTFQHGTYLITCITAEPRSPFPSPKTMKEVEFLLFTTAVPHLSLYPPLKILFSKILKSWSPNNQSITHLMRNSLFYWE